MFSVSEQENNNERIWFKHFYSYCCCQVTRAAQRSAS